MAATAAPKTRQLYQFGAYRLDADKELLLRDGEPVSIRIREIL